MNDGRSSDSLLLQRLPGLVFYITSGYGVLQHFPHERDKTYSYVDSSWLAQDSLLIPRHAKMIRKPYSLTKIERNSATQWKFQGKKWQIHKMKESVSWAKKSHPVRWNKPSHRMKIFISRDKINRPARWFFYYLRLLQLRFIYLIPSHIPVKEKAAPTMQTSQIAIVHNTGRSINHCIFR